MLSLTRVAIDTGSEDSEGLQLFVDGTLIAIFVRLDEYAHGLARGRWYLEAGFGRFAGA